MIEKRDLWIVGGLAVLLVNVVVGFHFYERGKMKVALQSTRDSLSVVQRAAKAIEKTRDSLTVVLATDRVRSDASAAQAEKSKAAHESAKQQVTLHGDTAVTKDTSQVLLPEVAERLRTAEKRATDAEKSAADLKNENLDLRFTLHADTLSFNNQLEQIRLNQNIAKMVEGPKCQRKCGIVIGVLSTAGAVWLASKTPR